MKTDHRFMNRTEQGIMLLDCMVYLTLLVLIFGLAVAAFFEANDNSNHLAQNAADIVRAMHAGERWRADIRKAVSVKTKSDGQSICSITQTTGEIRYIFSEGMVYRQSLSGTVTNRVLLLPSVKTSVVEADQRSQVTAWRWEIELSTSQKAARVRPLFTFSAVPKSRPAL